MKYFICIFAKYNNSFYFMRKNSIIIVKGLLILFAFLINSCDNKNMTLTSNIIQLESAVGSINILNLSDYATEIEYIPLETNDTVLIGRIGQISYENEKILIKDVSNTKYNCYLFDNNGEYCFKIGNYGQGPDDYLDIRQTFIFENYIYLIDAIGNKLLIYNTNGLLVENNN